jgi:hypothetical protein
MDRAGDLFPGWRTDPSACEHGGRDLVKGLAHRSVASR